MPAFFAGELGWYRDLRRPYLLGATFLIENGKLKVENEGVPSGLFQMMPQAYLNFPFSIVNFQFKYFFGGYPNGS